MKTVRVALAGVGNCASAFVQGAAHYRREPNAPGLITKTIGSYGPGTVEVVAAFDVNELKVGRPLHEAIYVQPTNFPALAHVPPCHEVIVEPGPAKDGIGLVAAERVHVGMEGSVDSVVASLRMARAEVLVNFLPVGAEAASRCYAEAALLAGCAFVNAIPVFIARHEAWRERFREAGLPLIGDDVKSQLGATILHRALAQSFSDRGVALDRTYQLNVGGNMDFFNMLERDRLGSKKVSKTGAVTDVANRGEGVRDVHISPSDYVEWLGDTKVAFIRAEGSGFLSNPIRVEMRYEGLDSPNSAGVVYDCVRWAKVALEMEQAGPLEVPSAFYMKAPPVNVDDREAAAELAEMAEMITVEAEARTA